MSSIVSRRIDNDPLTNNFFTSLRRKLLSTINDTMKLWRKLSGDRFRWQLFKSILFFTVGLKLFDDVARDFAKESTKRCVKHVVKHDM
ncbi:hypothetical protein ABMA27_007458 [Loxostege sticticalis]|uniref:Uncharacterized protein n=1 Tax=Loxostege sticticalis TaxID=481309 RepID=A0ABR3HFX3_LOXSC